MRGVLLISHGTLAEGVKKTTEIFFGENIPQFDSLCLSVSQTAESFRELLLAKVDELDQGNGVIVIADLMGGTPCNQCIFLDPQKCQVVTGLNLPLVMECLASRESEEFDFDNFAEHMKESIVNFSKLIKEKKEKRNRK